MEEQKAYICKKDFPNLGLEAGDYFPSYKFTKVDQQGNITQCIQKSSDVEWCYIKFYKGY